MYFQDFYASACDQHANSHVNSARRYYHFDSLCTHSGSSHIYSDSVSTLHEAHSSQVQPVDVVVRYAEAQLFFLTIVGNDVLTNSFQNFDLHASGKHRHRHRHTRKLRSAATLWFDLMLI